MNTILKTNLFLFLSLFAMVGFSQEKSDIGLLLSTQDRSRFGIEYRMQKTEKLKFKMGAFYGQRNISNFSFYTGQYSVSDSNLYFRSVKNVSNYGALQLGVERQMSNSVFSFSADLNIAYQQLSKEFVYQNRKLYSDGDLGNGWHVSDVDPLHPNLGPTHITQHFILPSFRLGFNMNVPLGDEFIISFSGISTVGVPIYMGATNRNDPNNDFGGTPPSIFNFESLGTIGLRYILGGKK